MNLSYKLKLWGKGKKKNVFSVVLKAVQKAVFQSAGFAVIISFHSSLPVPLKKHLNTQEYIMMSVFAEML